MTREEFLQLLRENNINENIVVFDDPLKDGYCVRKNYFRWEVFFRECGVEHNLIGYPSESDALTALFEKLMQLKG